MLNTTFKYKTIEAVALLLTIVVLSILFGGEPDIIDAVLKG
jgi:hypothetical protein